jgi:hypothetical protein
MVVQVILAITYILSICPINYRKMNVEIILFLAFLGLNSGPHYCKAGTLPLEPLPQEEIFNNNCGFV